MTRTRAAWWHGRRRGGRRAAPVGNTAATEEATASAGIAIAHHLTPLSAVLRATREAEKLAKERSDLDASKKDLAERVTKLRAEWEKPLVVAEPELPSGDVILSGQVETRAIGSRLSTEKYVSKAAEDTLSSEDPALRSLALERILRSDDPRVREIGFSYLVGAQKRLVICGHLFGQDSPNAIASWRSNFCAP